MFRMGYDKSKTELDDLRDSYLIRTIPEMLTKDEQMSQFETETKVDRVWLGNLYAELVKDWKSLKAKQGDNQVAWQDQLYDMGWRARKGILNMGQASANEGSLRIARSMHMHRFALRHKNERIAWKIGDNHVKDILELVDGPNVPYSLIPRMIFNEILIQAKYEREEGAISKSKIRKQWKDQGYLRD